MEFETSDSSLRQPLHPDLIHPADPTDTHPYFLQQGYPYNLNASAFDNIPALSIPDLDNFNATHSFDLNRMSTSKTFMTENLCGPDIHSLPVSRTSNTFSSSSSTHDHYLGPDISDHEGPQPSVIDNPSHRFNVRRLVEKAPNTDQPERPRISTQSYKSTQYIAPKMSNYESFTPSGIHTPSHSCNAHYVTWGTSNYTNLESSGMSNLMQNFAPQLSESNVFKSSDFFAPCYQFSSMANPKIFKPPISHTEDLFVRDTLNSSGLGPANISNTDDVDMHMENNCSSTFGDNILDAPMLQSEEQITEQPVRYTGSMEAPRRRKRGRPRKGSIVLRPVQEPSQKKRRSKATNRNGVGKYHSRNSQRTNAKDGRHIHSSYRASEDNDAEVQDLMNKFTTINDKTGPYADEDSRVPDALELNAKHYGTCPSAKDAGSEEIPQRRKTSRATNPNGACKPRSTNPRRADPKFWFFCIDPDCKASREKRTRGMPLKADIDRHLLVHFDKRFRCTLPHTKADNWFCRHDQLEA